MSAYPDARRAMSRTHERLAIRRNLDALDAERASGLGPERFADPFEGEARPAAEPADQGMEDL